MEFENIKQVFSKRVLKSKYAKETIDSIQNTLRFFNDAKIKTYHRDYEKQINGKNPYGKLSQHLFVKNTFKINTYYTNFIIRSANGILKSQRESHKSNIQSLKNIIKTAQTKLKTEEKKLENKQKILDSIIGFTKGKKKKISFYKGSIEGQKGVLFVVRLKTRSLIFYNLYNFEHMYLKPEMKKIQNRMNRIKKRIHRLENKLQKIEKGFKGATFGGKSLFKKQHTVPHYVKKHDKWKEEFHAQRYFSMEMSGRHDAASGNFVFRYVPDKRTLYFQTHDEKLITIENLEFPYGQKWLDDAILLQKERHKPIGWSIEDYGGYYIFKATVHVPVGHLNFSKNDGIISYDVNYDHIAWTDVNKEGNLVDFGEIPMKLDGLTSGQATKVIEEVAIKLVNIAAKKKKPLGREDLDTTDSKSKLQYGSKKRNKKISQFAYKKVTDATESRALKSGTFVFKTNPAYTSQIGKIKYMREKGISIHISAAFVIGRRILGKKDKLPKDLKRFLSDKQVGKHHWSHWSYVSKSLKEVKPKLFYDIKSKEKQLNTCIELKQYKEVLTA